MELSITKNYDGLHRTYTISSDKYKITINGGDYIFIETWKESDCGIKHSEEFFELSLPKDIAQSLVVKIIEALFSKDENCKAQLSITESTKEKKD